MLHLLLCSVVPLVLALNDEEKKFIVEKHNFYRSTTDPPASDMMALRWDPSLEKLAKSYAAKCMWEHNEERGYTGENLFLMSGSELDLELGLSDWHRERDYYNFTTTTCQEDKMCGHYTQMVWAETKRVGCGEHFCEKIEGYDEPNVYFLVCNYKPPGNFRGKQPYQVGVPCTRCPVDSVCNGSLCDEGPDLEEISPSPDTMETESQTYSSSASFIQTSSEQVDVVSPGSSLSPNIEDASLELTPVVTNTSPTLRPEDAQLNQTMEYFRTSAGTTPSNGLLAASSAGPSRQTPPADPTLSPLIVTRNGQVTAPLGTTYPPPSSFGSTSPPSHVTSQTSKQETTSKPTPADQTQLNRESDRAPAPTENPTLTPGVVTDEPSVQEHTEQVVGIGTMGQQQEIPLQTVTPTPKQKPSPPATGQKDHKPADSYQKPIMEVQNDKTQAERNMNSVLYSKKYPLKTGVTSQKWNFRSDGSDQTLFGKHVYRPHSIKAYVPRSPRAFCPYPCARQPSKLSLVAPLYRTSSVSHSGGNQQKWWPVYKASSKPSSKIPCKPSAYRKGVYSLYLPQSGASKNNVDNLNASDMLKSRFRL